MRHVRNPQMELGEIGIEDIWINLKSRDDIPALLLGLQHLYADEETRTRLFALLEEHMLPGVDRTVGRPGMELWRILVMGVVMQGLGCDFDRLHELVNEHNTLRQFLGHADIWDKRQVRVPDGGGQRVSGASRVVGGSWPADSGERPCGREKKAWRAVARAL